MIKKTTAMLCGLQAPPC